MQHLCYVSHFRWGTFSALDNIIMAQKKKKKKKGNGEFDQREQETFAELA